MEFSLIQKIAIYALPVVFAITLHEAAHGYVAKRLGDNTAYLEGRVTLNPLKHIDPIGTVLLPIITMLVGGILFGWAKPVPVTYSNLRHPKRDMMWVALAGPGANLVMALLWALVIRVAAAMPENSFALPLALMGEAGMGINAVLMVLNLLPVPPLDGGRVAVGLLPHRAAYRFAMLEPYGMIVLVVLLFSGLLGTVMHPLIDGTISLISAIFGV